MVGGDLRAQALDGRGDGGLVEQRLGLGDGSTGSATRSLGEGLAHASRSSTVRSCRPSDGQLDQLVLQAGASLGVALAHVAA